MVPHDFEYLKFESTDRKRQVYRLKCISGPHYSGDVEMSGGGRVAELVLQKFCEADLPDPVQKEI